MHWLGQSSGTLGHSSSATQTADSDSGKPAKETEPWGPACLETWSQALFSLLPDCTLVSLAKQLSSRNLLPCFLQTDFGKGALKRYLESVITQDDGPVVLSMPDDPSHGLIDCPHGCLRVPLVASHAFQGCLLFRTLSTT